MAINFAAANMAGYNNPNVQIITHDYDNPATPTYDEIKQTLARGVIPIMIASVFNDLLVFHLSLVTDTLCEFTCAQFGTTSESAPLVIQSIQILKNSGTPAYHAATVTPSA